jgi:hypothetical protein
MGAVGIMAEIGGILGIILSVSMGKRGIQVYKAIDICTVLKALIIRT